jgi:hypothetical protein
MSLNKLNLEDFFHGTTNQFDDYTFTYNTEYIIIRFSLSFGFERFTEFGHLVEKMKENDTFQFGSCNQNASVGVSTSGE